MLPHVHLIMSPHPTYSNACVVESNPQEIYISFVGAAAFHHQLTLADSVLVYMI
jgi:hypothetical protein